MPKFELRDEDGRVWASGVTPNCEGKIMGLVTDEKSEITTQMVEASNLPHIELSTLSTDKEIAVANTQALTVAAKALNTIANFIAGGGFNNLLQGYARSQSVTAILGGLASNDGRKSLDARTMDQNALEMPIAIEKVFKAYEQRLIDLSLGKSDAIVKPPEEDPGNRYFKEVDGKQVEVDKKGNPIT